jgi:hypothetical protein
MRRGLALALLLSACTRANPGAIDDDLGADTDLGISDDGGAGGDLAGDDLGFGTSDLSPGVDLIGCMPTPEVCDGKDNDCNGTIDDGIPGVGVACGSMTAVGGCVEKTACVPGTGVVCLGTFVSLAGMPTNAGTKTAPVNKITDGIRNAILIGGGADVCVCDNNNSGFSAYNEDITLVEGVSLNGGYNCTFTNRSFGTFETRIVDTDAVAGLKIPPGITAATALDGFTVRGADAPGATSVAITVLSSSPTLADINSAGGPAAISVGLYVTRSALGVASPTVNRGTYAGRATGGGREVGISFDNGATGTLTNVIASNVPPSGVVTNAATSVGVSCGAAGGCPGLKITGGGIAGGPASAASVGLYATGNVAGMEVRDTAVIAASATTAAGSASAGVSLDNCTGSPLFSNNQAIAGGGGATGARIGFAASGVNCKPTVSTNTPTHSIRGAEGDVSAATAVSCEGAPCNVSGYTIVAARRTTIAGVGVSCSKNGCGTIHRNTISAGAITTGSPSSSLGVAVDLTDSSPTLDANLVTGPTCSVLGPGAGASLALNALHLKNSSATITNNVFRDGTRGAGGATCALDLAVVSFEADDVSEPILHSNTIEYAPSFGYLRVGIATAAGSASVSGQLRNNIIVNMNFGNIGIGNTGIAIAAKGTRPTLMENNDLWDDVLYDDSLMQYKSIAAMEAAVMGAAKNLSAAPAFDFGNPYHLTQNSPCANQGTSTGAPAADRDGDTRPKQGQFDIGADEFVP